MFGRVGTPRNTTAIDGFAECLKHSAKALLSVALGKEGSAYSASTKAVFAEYFFSGTRQSGLPSAREHSTKKSSHYGDGMTETESLPSVYLTALGKESARGVPLSGTLPSAWYGTRQSVVLCRVSEPLHSAKNLYRCLGLGSLPSAMPLTLGKAPLCWVSHSTKWPVYTFFICFLYSIQTKKDTTYTSHISHIYITDIITNINIQHRHKYPSYQHKH